MRYSFFLILSLFISLSAYSDTPPPKGIDAKLQDGVGNPISSTVVGPSRGINVNLLNTSLPVTVEFPETAATADNQVTGNASLATISTSAAAINGKMNSLGQKPKAGSMPVVLPSDQVVAVSGNFWQATQPVSGTLTCNAGTGTLAVSGPLTDTQLRAAAVPVSGTFWQTTQPVSGTLTCNAGTGTQLVDGSAHVQPVSGTFWQATQPVSGTVAVSNFPGTQPVSGTVGATQSGTWTVEQGSPPWAVTGTFWQATQPVSGPLTDTQLRAAPVPISGSLTVTGALTDDELRASAVPVSLAAIPLASGAATEAKQDAGNASLVSIDSKLDGPIPVSGTFWQATQPVSGTFWQATQPVSGPLTDTQLRAAAVPVSGTFWQATQPVSGTVAVSNAFALNSTLQDTQGSVGGGTAAAKSQLAGAQYNTVLPTLTNGQQAAFQVDENGKLLISGASSVSGTVTANIGTTGGLALDATLGTTNTKLTSIDAALAGTLLVDGSGVTQPVSGTFWQATQPVSGPLTDTQLRATAVPVSGTFWQATQPVSGTVAATQSGTWNITNISGTVSLPTGASTALNQTTANSSLAAIDTKLGGTLLVDGSGVTQPVSGTFWQATQPVSGPLTDTQLRATAVPVSGTFWQATQPVSGTVAATQSGTWNINDIIGTISLPTGAATALNQTTANSSLSSIDGKIPASLTVTSTRLLVDGSGVNQPVKPAVVIATGSRSTDGDVVASIDVSDYKTITVQLIGAFDGEVQWYASNNNSTWVPIVGLDVENREWVNAGIGPGVWQIPVSAKYFKALLAGNSSGSAVSTVAYSTVQASSDTALSDIDNYVSLISTTTDDMNGKLDKLTDIKTNTEGTIRGQTVTAAITAPSQSLILDVNGASTCSFQASGVWSGLIAAYGSDDGSTYKNIPLFAWADGSRQTFSADNEVYSTYCSGFKNLKILQVTLVSGTLTINAWTSAGGGPTMVSSWNAANFKASADLHDGSGTSITSSGGALDVNLKTSSISLPVTIASLPALSAGSAIIGNVRIDQTTPGTTNGVQINAALPAGSNVIGHVIADTGSTTAVTQATGSNLHAVVDSGTITTVGAVTAITNALPAGSNLLGKTGIDQTTPGTTNGVSLSHVGSTAVATGNGTVSAGVQRVAIASDNTAFSVNAQPVASTAASQTTGTVSTVITLTAPANAQGFILQNLGTSTANLRFAMGATATTSLGMQLAPGQDSGFVPAGVNISLVAESGTQNYNVQWVSR